MGGGGLDVESGCYLYSSVVKIDGKKWIPVISVRESTRQIFRVAPDWIMFYMSKSFYEIMSFKFQESFSAEMYATYKKFEPLNRQKLIDKKLIDKG